MDTATVTPRSPAPPLTGRLAPSARQRRRAQDTSRRRLRNLHGPVLAILLVVTFLLRLWGIRQGLPYSYNVDEATHFVPRAIAFFSHDYNPQYFLNPPGYSYLLHLVFELWFGSGDAVTRAFATNPTGVFVIARVVAALLGTVAVCLTSAAVDRLLGRSVCFVGPAVSALVVVP